MLLPVVADAAEDEVKVQNIIMRLTNVNYHFRFRVSSVYNTFKLLKHIYELIDWMKNVLKLFVTSIINT